MQNGGVMRRLFLLLKKYLVFLEVVVMLGSLLGCQKTTESTTAHSSKIFFTTYNANENFPSMIADTILAYAQKHQIEIAYEDAALSAEKQVAHIKQAVSEGYDSIICIPLSSTITPQLIEAAGKTPIVFVNSDPGEAVLSPNQFIYVGSKEREAGTYQAEYIASFFKDKKDLNVVLLEGELTHPATIARTNAVQDYFEEQGIAVHYVFKDTANWAAEEAKSVFNLFLKTKQDFDCVICNNDGMALGVIEAYQEHHIDAQSHPVLGIDATAEGCQAIQEGLMSFTVYQSATGQGEYAIKATQLLGKGESIETLEYASSDCQSIWVPFEKVDRSNVENYQ